MKKHEVLLFKKKPICFVQLFHKNFEKEIHVKNDKNKA